MSRRRRHAVRGGRATGWAQLLRGEVVGVRGGDDVGLAAGGGHAHGRSQPDQAATAQAVAGAAEVAERVHLGHRHLGALGPGDGLPEDRRDLRPVTVHSDPAAQATTPSSGRPCPTATCDRDVTGRGGGRRAVPVPRGGTPAPGDPWSAAMTGDADGYTWLDAPGITLLCATFVRGVAPEEALRRLGAAVLRDDRVTAADAVARSSDGCRVVRAHDLPGTGPSWWSWTAGRGSGRASWRRCHATPRQSRCARPKAWTCSSTPPTGGWSRGSSRRSRTTGVGWSLTGSCR